MDHMTLKAMYKDILRMHLKHRRIQLHSQVSRLLDLNSLMFHKLYLLDMEDNHQ